MQDLVNKWYEAVEQEHDSTVIVIDAYVAHCILHYTSEKATKCNTPTREEKLIQKLRKLLKPTKD